MVLSDSFNLFSDSSINFFPIYSVLWNVCVSPIQENLNLTQNQESMYQGKASNRETEKFRVMWEPCNISGFC